MRLMITTPTASASAAAEAEAAATSLCRLIGHYYRRLATGVAYETYREIRSTAPGVTTAR